MNLNMNNVKIEIKSPFVVVVTGLTLLLLFLRLICPVKFSLLYVLVPLGVHFAVVAFQTLLAYGAILFRLITQVITKLQDKFNS